MCIFKTVISQIHIKDTAVKFHPVFLIFLIWKTDWAKVAIDAPMSSYFLTAWKGIGPLVLGPDKQVVQNCPSFPHMYHVFIEIKIIVSIIIAFAYRHQIVFIWISINFQPP
jgi:hypothetical protein